MNCAPEQMLWNYSWPMALFDIPLSELWTYDPQLVEPKDFDIFWDETLAEQTTGPLDLVAERIDNRLSLVETWDLTFNGFGESRVKAWLHLPAGMEGPLPAIVQYHGYSGGRGMPLSSNFAQAGYAHFELDTRGQGWSARSLFETTPDDHPLAGLACTPGFMTRGVLDPASYYYRRLFTDCVRLLQVAISHERVDRGRVVVTGGSQGGGMAIATAGLAARLSISLAGCAPDVPFLCHFGRAVEIASDGPYPEIASYLATFPQHLDQVFNTLSYFDGVYFASRIECPVLFSVAMMDPICPPSTVFAAYNRIDADKEITVYRFNGHEGGGELQTWNQLGWLRERFC